MKRLQDEDREGRNGKRASQSTFDNQSATMQSRGSVSAIKDSAYTPKRRYDQ